LKLELLKRPHYFGHVSPKKLRKLTNKKKVLTTNKMVDRNTIDLLNIYFSDFYANNTRNSLKDAKKSNNENYLNENYLKIAQSYADMAVAYAERQLQDAKKDGSTDDIVAACNVVYNAAKAAAAAITVAVANKSKGAFAAAVVAAKEAKATYQVLWNAVGCSNFQSSDSDLDNSDVEFYYSNFDSNLYDSDDSDYKYYSDDSDYSKRRLGNNLDSDSDSDLDDSDDSDDSDDGYSQQCNQDTLPDVLPQYKQDVVQLYCYVCCVKHCYCVVCQSDLPDGTTSCPDCPDDAGDVYDVAVRRPRKGKKRAKKQVAYLRVQARVTTAAQQKKGVAKSAAKALKDAQRVLSPL
jgi:hypothetical protein